MLTRDQILNANDLPTEVVPVPEWGGEGAAVTVRRLKASEFLRLVDKVKSDPDRGYAYWIVYTVVDEQGNPLFTEADAEALAGKSMTAINRVFEAAERLNPMRKDEAAKNSQATPSDDSSSVSH